MAAYIKSAVWLLGCGGIGYILLKISTPNEEYIEKIKKTYSGVDKSKFEALEKKQQFMNVLKAATEADQSISRFNTRQTGKFFVQAGQSVPDKED